MGGGDVHEWEKVLLSNTHLFLTTTVCKNCIDIFLSKSRAAALCFISEVFRLKPSHLNVFGSCVSSFLYALHPIALP